MVRDDVAPMNVLASIVGASWVGTVNISVTAVYVEAIAAVLGIPVPSRPVRIEVLLCR